MTLQIWELLSVPPTWQFVENGKDILYETAAGIGHAMLGSGRADTLHRLEAMVNGSKRT